MAPTNVNSHIVWEALGLASPPVVERQWVGGSLALWTLANIPWHHTVGWQAGDGSLPTTLPPLQTRVKLWGCSQEGFLRLRLKHTVIRSSCPGGDRKLRNALFVYFLQT